MTSFVDRPTLYVEALSFSKEFDIFAEKPVQTSVQETVETL